MAKTEIILYRWKTLKDNTHPVMLRIAKDKKRKLLATGLKCFPKQWNDEFGLFVKDKRLTEDHEEKNEAIGEIKTKADNIIKEFDRLGIDWTLRQFEAKMKKRNYTGNPSDLFETHIQNLKNVNKFGYAEVFSSTLRILRIYDKDFVKAGFADIDHEYVHRFESYLRHTRKLKDTSISVYMRTLATLLNVAIEKGMMQEQSYPFGKGGYKISKLDVRTRKRYIPSKYLVRLRKHEFNNLRLETARNLFFFSFFCRGINWIDMALLTNANISKRITPEGTEVKILHYMRSKTRKKFEIIINGDIEDLIVWFESMPRSKPYLLPIITKPEHEGEKLRQHIANRRGKFNKALHDIAKHDELEFPESLQDISSYFARHSFAMAMQEKGRSLELIQETLGHQTSKQTKTYLEEMNLDIVAAATEDLL